MTLQGTQLTMAALGLDVADQIEAGVHLRWAVAASVGFPPHGFALFRRPHLASPPRCVPPVILAGGNPYLLTAGDLAVSSTLPMRSDPAYGPSSRPAIVVNAMAELTITCALAMCAFTVAESHAVGTVRVTAYDHATPVGHATLSAPGDSVTLAADRFTQVVISTDNETDNNEVGFHALCRVAVPDGAGVGWGAPLAELNLPPDWPTAAARLPAAVRPRYEPDFARLREVIGLLPTGPTYYTAASTTTPPPRFLVQPVQLMLLAALDPFVARMLGLYYLDMSAAPGMRYDYLLVGNWTAPRSADHAWICLDVGRGTPAAVGTPTGLRVQARQIGGGLIAGAPSDDQMTAALAWSLPRDAGGGLEPGAPVSYHVWRGMRRATGWTPPSCLTTDRPILVAADAATGDLPTDFYVDGPLSAGDVRYQVQGVDLFGRVGVRSAAVAVTLADDTPPPPPVEVAGGPTQAGGRTDVTVSWAWTDDQRVQAGDAAAFQVYYQTEGIRAPTGTLTAVGDNGDGTSNAVTDLASVANAARFVGGTLINRGHAFPVEGAAVMGAALTLRVRNLVGDDGGAILPQAQRPIPGRTGLAFLADAGAAQGRFSLRAEWSDPSRWQPADHTVPVTAAERYDLTLRNLPLTVGPLTPVAYAFVGVATVDRAGNVGAVSPPVTVAVAHAVAPPTPPAATGPTVATRADYHGRSRATLTFDGTEPGLRYDVYRALDAAILARSGRASADDATLLTLADRHEDIFVCLDARDAAGQPLAGTGGAVTWTDDLPGTGRNRYVYKIQTVDLAGNRSALSPGLVVHLIDVVPPCPPVVTGATGGDRRIALEWAKNREPDLALYRLYRTDVPEAAEDVRAMAQVAAFLLDPATATAADRALDATAALSDDGDGRLRYTDPDVAGRTDTFYRLVAVDAAGNPSRPSQLVRARAYDAACPDPPTWETPIATADGLALGWRAPDAALSSSVQRRARGDAAWGRLSPWLPRGAYAYTDVTRADSVAYEYRLLVLDAEGRANAVFNVLAW